MKLRSHFLFLFQRILRNPLLVGTKSLYIRSIVHTKNVYWKTEHSLYEMNQKCIKIFAYNTDHPAYFTFQVISLFSAEAILNGTYGEDCSGESYVRSVSSRPAML